MKVCSKCKVEKDESLVNQRNIDGLCESCKKCSNERNAIYRANNREKIIGSRNLIEIMLKNKRVQQEIFIK